MYRIFLAAGDEAAAGGGMELWTTLLFMVVIFVVFYFLLIRPENKRKKQAKQMRDELIVGDEVTTIGGIVGRVVSIKDDDLVIESGFDKARIKVKKWAISNKEEKISE